MSYLSVLGFKMKKGAVANTLMFVFAFAVMCIAQPVFAAGGLGSLDKATNALQDILSWLKVFVVVASILYITYLVVMAIAEKKAWSDVMMGLVYCAIAGGVVMGGEWATTLWD